MTGLQFKDVYWLSLTCLKINRVHPEIIINWKWAIQIGSLYGLFTIVCSSVFYSMVAVDIKEDITKTCTDGIYIVIYFMVAAQFGVLMWYRSHVKMMIQHIQKYYDLADSLPTEERDIVVKYAYRGRLMSKLWLFTYSLNASMFPLKSLILSIYSFYFGEHKLVPMYDYAFISPIEEVKYRPDIFFIIFIAQLFFALYSISMYIGFCPLGPIFILNICAQLELMAKKIGTIFKQPYDPKEAARNIAVVVQKLQKIYSYVNLINDVFRVFYEITLKTTAILFPIIFSQIIDSLRREELCLEYIAAIISNTVVCFVPCYYCDLLMEKGEELRLAIYRSGWETVHDKDARQSLLIMLSMAIQPICIRSIFCTVCLDAFAEVCHHAYAIFNLLSASRD